MATRYTMSPKVKAPMSVKRPVAIKGFNTAPPASPAGALAPPPAAPPALAPPPDAGYEQQAAGLERQRDTTLAGLEQQRAGGLLQYGYKQDPLTGAVSFDATNTYGQAALLKRNYEQARTGNVNTFAARGQLYAGSLQSAQDESQFRQGQGEDALQKQLAAFLARNSSAKGQAQADYEIALGDAKGGAIARIPDNPLYDPGADPLTAAARAAAAAAPASISAPAAGHVGTTARVAAQKAPAAAKKIKVVKASVKARPQNTPGPSRGRRRR